MTIVRAHLIIKMINYDLTKIKAMAFDVDGVLSDPLVALLGDQPIRTAHTKDGYVLQLACKSGFKMAIITGGKSEPVRERYENLGFQDVFMACHMKIDTLVSWMDKYKLNAEEVLYMGDDIPDYPVMKKVGCSCCPSDAAHEIQSIATYVSPFAGGRGCVRDVVEQVLRAQGFWMAGNEAFGW